MADAAGSGQSGAASGDGEKGAGGEEGLGPSASPSRPAAAGAARGAHPPGSGMPFVNLLERPARSLAEQASRPSAPSGGAAISRQQRGALGPAPSESRNHSTGIPSPARALSTEPRKCSAVMRLTHLGGGRRQQRRRRRNGIWRCRRQQGHRDATGRSSRLRARFFTVSPGRLRFFLQ